MNVRRLLPAAFGLVLVVCLATVATAAGAPLARYLDADTDRVELRDGRGVAVLVARGAIFGSLGRGRLRIVDLRRGEQTEISVYGAESVRVVNDRVTIYRGRRISFYVEEGWWKVHVKGNNIDAGAAVHGRLALEGRAGVYSLRDGAPQDWPRHRRVFKLG